MIYLTSPSSLAIIACWGIFLFYWLVSSFFVKKSSTKRNWSFEIFWRVGIIIAAIVFITTVRGNTPALSTFFSQSQFSFEILGPVLTVLGLIGAIWARIALGSNWSAYVTYKKEHELVTTGPYKYVRHPIYSSMLLMLIGSILYYGVPALLLPIIMAAIFFIVRAKREEKLMIKLFGKKYLDYMKKSKMLIPFIL